MKTYTQKQMDRAKRVAYKKGYNLKAEEEYMRGLQNGQEISDEIWRDINNGEYEESVDQIKSWDKYNSVPDRLVTYVSVGIIALSLIGYFLYQQAESINTLLK